MGGLIAAAGLLPKALAGGTAARATAPAATAPALRPEPRAVVRQEGTV